MMKHGATNTTPEQETKINAYLLKISGHPRFNAAEKQEVFLRYLESMDLTNAAGNKVNEYHITGGWYLGIDVCITAEKINNKWVYYCNTELLETYENSILYYLPRELGTRVAYWAGNKSGMAVYSDGE